jgi:hypothetical protein
MKSIPYFGFLNAKRVLIPSQTPRAICIPVSRYKNIYKKYMWLQYLLGQSGF